MNPINIKNFLLRYFLKWAGTKTTNFNSENQLKVLWVICQAGALNHLIGYLVTELYNNIRTIIFLDSYFIILYS